MSGGLVASEEAPADRYDLALVDLDGVAYRGPDPIEHASSSLTTARARGMRLVFVTNNASREPGTVAEHLTGLDIPTTPDEVMTAAQACAQLLTTRLDPGARVLVVGAAGLLTAVREAGFTVVGSADDDPAAVAQGFGPEVGWERLAEAAYAVQRGAWHVASNLDLSIPTARGTAPGNGSLVAAVVAATGVTPDSSGKPSPTMYDLAVERVGARRALVVGDRLDTDLAGARGGGYDGLHVLTGVSTARDAVLAPPHLRPHLLGADLRALLVPHPAPARGADGWWTCRDAAARAADGRLELRGPATVGEEPEAAVDLARAACAAAWAAADEGHPVAADAVPELVVR